MATDTAPTTESPAPPPYTTPPSLRNAGFILMALFAVVTVAWVALLALDELAKEESRTTRSLGVVTTVRLESDEGEITVRPGTGRTATIETIEQHGLFGSPDIELRNEGGRLIVDSDCPPITTSCTVEHVVTVPRGVPVELRTGSGDIEVAGVIGDANLHTGSGEITVDGLRDGDLTARTGSGDIEALGIVAGAVDLRSGSGEIDGDLRATSIESRTGSGDIDLSVTGAAPRSTFAKTGSGEVSLLMPDADYAVDTDTGSGEEDVQVSQDPDAANRIDVETGSGDVEIRQR